MTPPAAPASHPAAATRPSGRTAATIPRGPSGIPTGQGGQGYPRLTPDAREAIDDALQLIADLLATGAYRRVVYSAANADGDLGTGIFEVGDDVKRYIVDGLRKLIPAG